MPRGNPEQLIPTNKRSKEEARELGRKGGIASGEARREKKLLSSLYAEMLADEYEVDTEDGPRRLEGSAYFKAIARHVLERKDSSSVAVLKEMREATEGSRVKLDGQITLVIDGDDAAL